MAAPSTPGRFYSDSEAAAALRDDPGFLQGSADPTEATAQTVQYMCRLIQDSLADGIVQRAVFDSRRFLRGGLAQAGSMPTPHSIWMWCKLAVKFVHHSKLLVEWLDAGDELQLLIRPDALLHMRSPKGDCAVFTCLVCAMLDCVGVPWEIVTVAVDPRMPGVYSHVYPRAVLPGGARLPLDASHGKYAGWEVPAGRVSAKAIWNESGDQIPDMDSGYRGLHGVSAMEQCFAGDFFYGPGLGQDDTTPYNPPDIAPDATVPSDWAGTAPYVDVTTFDGSGTWVPTTTGGVLQPGSTPTSGSISAAEVNALGGEASALTKIFGQLVAPTVTMTRNANGSYSYTAPATASAAALLPGGSSSLNIGGTAISTTNLMLYAGIGLAALFLFSQMSKK